LRSWVAWSATISNAPDMAAAGLQHRESRSLDLGASSDHSRHDALLHLVFCFLNTVPPAPGTLSVEILDPWVPLLARPAVPVERRALLDEPAVAPESVTVFTPQCIQVADAVNRIHGHFAPELFVLRLRRIPWGLTRDLLFTIDSSVHETRQIAVSSR
jgi:hypothetical protein